MGSVIAAQAAAGATPAEMVEINRMWARWNPLRDLSLPLVALVSGRSGFRLLAEMFAGRHIEDLWLPYFCVSTNLTRSRLVVHRNGPVFRAVRASISIPGLFPPVRTDIGDLLVDGGLLNNVPADVMQAAGAGRVVAVNVAPVHELAARAEFGEHPPAWRVLRSFLTAQTIGSRFPSIYRILERATLISSLAHVDRVRDRVDLFLDVPLEAYGTFSWKALEEIARRGYEWAQPRVEAWQLGLEGARDAG
jgi:predicted acylesterase/phospholipase RssA